MTNFAEIDDIVALWRKLTPEEKDRAEKLLPVVSDSLRGEAYKVGKDLDKMVSGTPWMENVVKSVTVDVIARALMTSTDAEPMTQISQSALGYSVSGTYLIPGGGLFIKRSELARLGLRRQKWGVVELYDNDQGDNGNAL